MIQDIDSRNPHFEVQSNEQPVMVSQFMTNLEVLRAYDDPIQCNPDIPSVAIPPPVMTENPSSLTHSHQMQEAVFEPAYVLAYGPFETPTLQ